MKYVSTLLLAGILFACGQESPSSASIADMLTEIKSLEGKPEYLNTPYITAGNRVYAVGHQDGTFPDLGWHVTGEMGGVWDHPFKLLDGYMLGLSLEEQYYCLNEAKQFINFPMANQQIFQPTESLRITRTQFAPDDVEGLVVEYQFENLSAVTQNLSLDFTAMVDLTHVWMSERLGIQDAPDLAHFDRSNEIWMAKDSLNDWFVAVGSDFKVSSSQLPYSSCSGERKALSILDLTLGQQFQLNAGSTANLHYFIAGSGKSEAEVSETLNQLKNNYTSLLQSKIDRYASIKNTAALSLRDVSLQQLYEWTKYTTDWLIREVPDQGRGLSAGTPDYPWWFGTDNTYALQGLLATGRHEEAKATIDLILKLSKKENGNGRIVHEVSTNGVVYNPGNLNTTPYFINLLWKYYTWTGDSAFLLDVYPEVQKGLHWLETQDKDANGYADGAGMMEIHGLHSEMIDVVSYSYAAYLAAAQMAETLHDHENQEIYQEKADLLKAKINTDWWVENAGSYADFRASKSETIQLIKDAIIRSDTIQKPWAVAELKSLLATVEKEKSDAIKGWVVHHNWVVNTPTEVGAADPMLAERSLETAKKYTSKYGMYVTGLDRDEATEASSKWKIFSYVGAVMTLPTGVQAISSARYGDSDAALEYLKMLENSFSYALPGSMYEVSPDYGMIAQAWNIYAVATPIVEYFFGVRPNAGQQSVTLEPQFPTSWINARLENSPVGTNMITIDKTGELLKITQTKADWEVIVKLPSGYQSALLNGQKVTTDELGYIRFRGLENEITFLKD